jgi:hypothetical protein
MGFTLLAKTTSASCVGSLFIHEKDEGARLWIGYKEYHSHMGSIHRLPTVPVVKLIWVDAKTDQPAKCQVIYGHDLKVESEMNISPTRNRRTAEIVFGLTQLAVVDGNSRGLGFGTGLRGNTRTQ